MYKRQGFMIIFGKDERVKFEEIRETLSDPVCRQYDEATTYRDGKWVCLSRLILMSSMTI